MIVEQLKAVFGLKMGCGQPSKHRIQTGNSNNKANGHNNIKQTQNANVEVLTVQKFDEIIVNVLFRDLQETPELFVLNNILMSIQFFENYHRDILKISHTEGTKADIELNKILLKEECVECICPDMIVDKMNKNVRFKPHHGPKKLFSEGMVVKRLYVVNDHIDVINSMDNIPQYTSIDKPAYQVRMEESTKKGFVRLKFIDSTKIPKIYEPVESLHGYSSPMSEVSDSDYTTITELRTPRLLDILHGVDRRRDSLPTSYFAQRKVKRKLSVSNPDGEYVNPDDETLYEKVTYLDATAFMSDFEKSIFPNSLGELLGFDETEISRAKSIPGKIFCNMIDEDDSNSFIPCEVIPSVAIDWPAEQAFEFQMREDRPTITDKSTGTQYRWPTDDMIQEIKSMTCVVIPRGYFRKRGATPSPNSNLEWEIAFPKAERYIESRMTHTQLRCLLFLLAIHKTYIEPVTHQNGLLVEHIRCHMYWECERDYRDWPEYRIGHKLKQVMQNLNKKLSRGEMADYFIKPKNVFENIPKKYLNFAQKIFHDITQSSVMHFIKILRNLQYPSDRFKDKPSKIKDFYSSLDWRNIHEILMHRQGLEMVNPRAKELITLRQQKFSDRDTQWEHLYHLKRKHQRLKKKLAEQRAKENENRRESADSINIEWICEKEFDIVKSKAICGVFVENFIILANISSRISTVEQSLFYLKQAWYLTRIMDKTSPSFGPEAMEYREQIQEVETIIKKQAATKRDSLREASGVPPEIPARNSVQFDMSTTVQLPKSILQRSISNNMNKTVKNLEKSSSVVKMSPSLKKSKSKIQYRKSISFVEPQK